MKSYTDLEQAKILAKILPLESADMEYIFLKKDNIAIGNVPFVKDDSEVENSGFDYIYNRTPCWSLTALLNVLPEIQGSKPVIDLNDNYITYPHMSDLHTKADNLVDACVAMIEKLNELNLL